LGILLARSKAWLFDCSADDMICAALLEERDAEIALSPGFWWGTSLLPRAPITVEDIHNMTPISYPEVYRAPLTGERLKNIMEDVADNLFHPDPYYQQGGDMIRCGGVGYSIDPRKPIGRRISDMVILKTGKPIEASRDYMVASWGCTGDAVEGPPVCDLVERYVARKKVVIASPASAVSVVNK